jgi:hypothetical protein
LKSRAVVHISFTHHPSAISTPMGQVAFATGLKLLVPTPGKLGPSAVKDFIG